MAKTVTYTCDNCGAVKEETNHWFFLRGDNSGLELNLWDNEVALQADTLLTLCGDACVLAKVQEFLGKVQKGVGT